MTKEYGHLEMIPQYSHIIKYGKIEIGEYTFIGARATILSGVKIGDHCVIGAGSFVNKTFRMELLLRECLLVLYV